MLLFSCMEYACMNACYKRSGGCQSAPQIKAMHECVNVSPLIVRARCACCACCVKCPTLLSSAELPVLRHHVDMHGAGMWA